MPGIFLSLTDEQEFVREAAAGTLLRQETLIAAREALDGGPRLSLWDVGVQAGWPGLISSEEFDGAGLGAYEAMLVLEACGARLADAGVLGHLPAVALLEQAGADEDLRRALATGEQRAALVDTSVELTIDAAGADVLVVVDDGGARLVTGSEATVTATPAYDATRSLATVSIVAGAGTALDLAAARVRDGLDLQRALLAADSVGAADAARQMATAYAIDRHAFGRAIGSYQAIKHKLVEMLRRTENARSLLVQAGRAWTEDRPAFALQANAARVVAADALDYCAPENIFVHGGVGATWEHDAQLYYRRAELARRLAGGAEAAAETVAEQLLARIAA
ncbi:MAG TPA: acyl-CoA dehydrogenase family protein [Solirubrobacteraceae bacterium]|nr:acyl-CoA dehydrogenase family protein [Solirubrobacteraceae bacterium]